MAARQLTPIPLSTQGGPARVEVEQPGERQGFAEPDRHLPQQVNMLHLGCVVANSLIGLVHQHTFILDASSSS